MRLGILIRRLNQLKHVRSLVVAARHRGATVTMVIEDDGTVVGGPKAHDAPTVARIAAVLSSWGVPADVPRPTRRVLDMAEQHRLDALVVIGRYPGDYRPRRCVVAMLQTAWGDLMGVGRPDGRYATMGRPARWDLILGWSETWRRWWHHPSWERAASDARAFDARFLAVGSTLTDAASCVPSRQRHGERRLLYLPFPFGAVPRAVWTHGVYRWLWPFGLLAAPFAHVGKQNGTPFADADNGSAWTDAWRGWNDRAVVRGLRAFCDRHGAAFVVKSRPKTPVPRYLRDVADVLVDRDTPGRATCMELAAQSDLVVHFYSMAVVEAAAVGTPWVTPWLCPGRWPPYATRSTRDALGSPMPWWRLYEWPELGEVGHLSDLAEGWSARSWPGGPDADALARYRTEILGMGPRSAADRVLDALAEPARVAA